METNLLPEAHTKLAAVCAAKVAQYPQYAPERYYGWRPLVARTRITNRGQVVAEKGDLLLGNPEIRDPEWWDMNHVTVVTAGYPHEVSVPWSKLDIVVVAVRHVEGLVEFA